MKVVIDTNVLVSGLIKPGSPPELILLLVLNDQVNLYISGDIFQEYGQVLSRGKFGKYLNSKRIKTFLSEIKERAVEINPQVAVHLIKEDPADNKFLECALEANADFFITGNKRHFPFKKFHKTRIVTPVEFLSMITNLL